MPFDGWYIGRWRIPTCSKPYKWSTYRGGCRFTPGHDGPCKPGKGGQHG